MATVTERSHANILPYPPLTPDFVSVTMPESGFLSAEVLKRHLLRPYARHEYFICGPSVMTASIEATLGAPLSKYHFRTL